MSTRRRNEGSLQTLSFSLGMVGQLEEKCLVTEVESESAAADAERFTDCGRMIAGTDQVIPNPNPINSSCVCQHCFTLTNTGHMTLYPVGCVSDDQNSLRSFQF